MIRSFVVATAALVLAGCASGGVETRAEELSIGPIDAPWVLRVQAIAQGDKCMLGFGGIGLINNGKTPLGGGFVAKVTDSSRAKTIGELNLTCPTAAPGGSATCTTAQPLTFTCQFVHIDARALPSPQ
jgi:hypothetical protein